MDEQFNETTFRMLESRVQKLEEKLIGSDMHAVRNPEGEDIISSLSELGSKLGNALSTRDRMMMVMKRMDELERYMDPAYGENSDLGDNVKMDLILSQEDRLHNLYQQLNRLSTLKKTLDSQPLADSVTSLNSDLTKVWLKHGETEQASKDQTEELNKLLKNYNSVLMTLTESFIKMDDIVTKAEIAAQPKKVLD